MQLLHVDLPIQYYHRNMATELGGVICGQYGGSVREQVAGGLTLENSYMPHGGSCGSDAALVPSTIPGC